nr:hypothetical protein B0A51_00926 [Rachicladosporium sp. CCFEE 5018]
MIERATKLKDAIELYQQHFRDDADSPTQDDCLTNDDRYELKLLLDLLAPLKRQSILVQHNRSGYGALHEALSTLDLLMTKLEVFRRIREHAPNDHLKASVYLGWKKLNKYYQLSDQTPAYRVAIMLHPHYKLNWFQKHWGEHHPEWINEAKKAVQQCFAAYEPRYQDLVTEPIVGDSDVKDLTKFERYNLITDDDALLNELERYLREPRALPRVDVLDWWRQHHI